MLAAAVAGAAEGGSRNAKPKEVEDCVCTGSTCSLVLLWNEIDPTAPELVLDQEFLATACADDEVAAASSTGSAMTRWRRATSRRGIAPGTVIEVTIKRFNFLKYDTRLETESKPIEAYALLNTLWTQILGLGGLLEAAAPGSAEPEEPEDKFLQALLEWEAAISALNAKVEEQLSLYQDSQLTADQVIAIGTVATSDVPRLRTAISTAETQVLQEAKKAGALAADVKFRLIQEFRGKQAEVLVRADAFQQRANRTVRGGKRLLRGTSTGDVVTATLTAVERNDATEDQVYTIRYFVSSPLRVVFHGGYGRANLRDLEFERVRTADGLDAFDLVGEDADLEKFMALLSVPLLSFDHEDRFGLLATLGTGVEDPGEALFAGLSVKVFRRFLLSYGQLSADEVEGVDPFVEEIGETLGSRELFASVDKRRDWGRFWGVSILIGF